MHLSRLNDYSRFSIQCSPNPCASDTQQTYPSLFQWRFPVFDYQHLRIFSGGAALHRSKHQDISLEDVPLDRGH